VNGHDIPGAPSWVTELLDRVQGIVDSRDDRIDRTLTAVRNELRSIGADVNDAINYYRGLNTKVSLLDKRVENAEAEIRQLRRSITPPGGTPMPPPDEAA